MNQTFSIFVLFAWLMVYQSTAVYAGAIEPVKAPTLNIQPTHLEREAALFKRSLRLESDGLSKIHKASTQDPREDSLRLHGRYLDYSEPGLETEANPDMIREALHGRAISYASRRLQSHLTWFEKLAEGFKFEVDFRSKKNKAFDQKALAKHKSTSASAPFRYGLVVKEIQLKKITGESLHAALYPAYSIDNPYPIAMSKSQSILTIEKLEKSPEFYFHNPALNADDEISKEEASWLTQLKSMLPDPRFTLEVRQPNRETTAAESTDFTGNSFELVFAQSQNIYRLSAANASEKLAAKHEINIPILGETITRTHQFDDKFKEALTVTRLKIFSDLRIVHTNDAKIDQDRIGVSFDRPRLSIQLNYQNQSKLHSSSDDIRFSRKYNLGISHAF